MSGQGGDDHLIGGTGGDRFIFDFGTTRIEDFTDNTDQILFHNIAGISTVADALSHAHQQGMDVVFEFGPASLIVANVTLPALSNDVIVT